MIALSYLWILALVPLLVEQDDRDVQWHAKHGLVLLVVEIILYAILAVVSMIPVIGCVAVFLPALVFLGFLIVRIMAIMKGINGERFVGGDAVAPSPSRSSDPTLTRPDHRCAPACPWRAPTEKPSCPSNP
jgi:uncharacterized membrane protein